jgi:hypothetical protein
MLLLNSRPGEKLYEKKKCKFAGFAFACHAVVVKAGDTARATCSKLFEKF